MSFGIQLACRRLNELGDTLSGLKSLIDWETFRPIVEGIYDNRTEKGGHPNYEEVLKIKILVRQQWYSLSDQ
jgi:IS5 family transposase